MQPHNYINENQYTVVLMVTVYSIIGNRMSIVKIGAS